MPSLSRDQNPGGGCAVHSRAPAEVRSSCELLTAPGPAAIVALRLCGPHVPGFLERHIRPQRGPAPANAVACQAGLLRRGCLLDPDGGVVDELLLSVSAAAPDWDVRLYLHGSPFLAQACRGWAAACGLYGPGGAPLWPASSRIEAEALELLPQLPTLSGVTWLLRSAQGLLEYADRCSSAAEGNSAADWRDLAAQAGLLLAQPAWVEWFRQPLRIGLVGPPNAGKSTLINALSDRNISLTSAAPGTTRDWVSAPGEIEGFPVLWLDTAGLRCADDPLEAAGIDRTHALLDSLEVIVLVVDGSAGELPEVARTVLRRRAGQVLVAVNKSDLAGWRLMLVGLPDEFPALGVSATQRQGLDELGRLVLRTAGRKVPQDTDIAPLTNRQSGLLQQMVAVRSREELQVAGAELAGRSGWPFCAEMPNPAE